MEPYVDVIGVGADGAAGLRPALIERIHAADFLAGGERHLAYFPDARGVCFVIKDNLSQLIDELSKRYPDKRCVVLASGDPLFFGVGTHLLKVLGQQNVRVEPTVSSMQIAFARAGIAWQDAALGSIHGRDLRSNLLPVLGERVIGLFTQDGDSPAAVAAFFAGYGLESDYEAIVGENLGAADERLTRWKELKLLTGQRFEPLNYLILQRTRHAVRAEEVRRNRARAPGIPDDAFEQPLTGPVLLTHQEVRSVVLAKLLGATAPGDTIWDIGAGLGTVSIEIAVLRPHVEVLAVECDPGRIGFLRRNRERFGAYNIRVVEGAAPEALAHEADQPLAVFIGGSGDRLPSILDLVRDRLRGGGRLVANFVTLENLTAMLQRLGEWGWPHEITEIHVARSDALAGLTGLKPQRGVFIVRAEKSETGHE